MKTSRVRNKCDLCGQFFGGTNTSPFPETCYCCYLEARLSVLISIYTGMPLEDVIESKKKGIPLLLPACEQYLSPDVGNSWKEGERKG